MGDRYLYDSLSTAEGGINSLLSPQLLPRNTLAWSVNATIRGGYIQPRPPLFQQTITYPSDSVRSAVEGGYFQGAGYYRPDYGSQQLVAQISGRLFTFTPQSADTWLCAEITIPGDPNSSTATQAWMNQAEKWMIITDGSAKLPIFYDGATTRRSYGPSVVLATTKAIGTFPDPRVIGEIITVELTAPYTGPFNVPVLFNNEFYQPISSPSTSYQVILTNQTAVNGSVVPQGSQIVVRSGIIGNVVVGGSMPANYPTIIKLSSVAGLSRGMTVMITAGAATTTVNPVTSFAINSIHPVGYGDGYIALDPILPPGQPPGAASRLAYFGTITIATTTPSGAVAQLYISSTSPDVIIGNTTLLFSNPEIGSDVTVSIDAQYSGPDGQSVWIGSSQYLIRSGPEAPASASLNLINLSDTADAGGAIPAEDILSVPELPAGRMGAYGLGHQCMCLTDGISFLYGDTVGGPSGTQANNYRDAVLKTTENDFLDSRGSFKLPTSGETIQSMTFTAILDAAYGQGPLQIGTQSTIFTCAVPTNQADWAALENPIVTETLIGKGPLAQNSTILANSDTIFRAPDGIGSLVYARREFITNWGNTPISTEVYRALSPDNVALLSVASAVTFDNRFLHTNRPTSGPSGIYHKGTVALNFDPVSSLKSKAASCWESLWTGTNTLQYIFGTFNNVDRCLLFAYDEVSGAIQLWDQLKSETAQYKDNGETDIEWSFETACIFKPQERDKSMPIVRLWNGRMHVSNIVGDVNIKVFYRPDFWPCWIKWNEFDLCATVDTSNTNSRPGYLDPIGFGEPSGTDCESGNNRPMRSGRFFQIRVEVTGKCTIMGMDFAAVPEPTIHFPAPKCEAYDCQTLVCSNESDYAYNMNATPRPNPATMYGNSQRVYQLCNSDAVVVPVPYFSSPGWISYNSTGGVVFAPNIYYATTQAAADAQADAALAEFVVNQLARNYDCVRP